MNLREICHGDMAQYKCHKVVRAEKIESIGLATSGLTRLAFSGGRCRCVKAEWVTRHRPKTGGYFVVYADGYESYSPGKAFEEGYTAMQQGGQACQATQKPIS